MSSHQSSSYEQRLQTYRNWPSSSCQRPEDLASAGFESEGRGDCVRCPTCQLRLFDWIPSDPLQQHGKFSLHKCDLYRQIRKQRFYEQQAKTLSSQESLQAKAQEKFTVQVNAQPSEPSATSAHQTPEVSFAPPAKYRRITVSNQESHQPTGSRRQTEQGIKYFPDQGAPLCEDKFSMNFKMPISNSNKASFQMNLQFGPSTVQGGFQFTFGKNTATQAHSFKEDYTEAPNREKSQDVKPTATEHGTTAEETSGEMKPRKPAKLQCCENFDEQVADYMKLDEFAQCVEMGINATDLRQAIRCRLQESRDVLMELGDIVEELCPA